jgi:hypothetical protein
MRLHNVQKCQVCPCTLLLTNAHFMNDLIILALIYDGDGYGVRASGMAHE